MHQAGVRGLAALLLAGLTLAGAGGMAVARPAPSPITPELIEAAKKEGKVVFYTAVDLEVSEKTKLAFEAKYPEIKVQVERAGAQRVFQRLGQEYGAGIFTADVVNSADAAHFVFWKKSGWLAPYTPQDVAEHYAPEHVDPDGLFATWKASLCVIGYNTKQVTAEQAPKSYADLLDPKWRGRIVKAHPGYSGTILTATYAITQKLGWDFYEKLAAQKVMQVQSSTDSPKKLAVGERAIMADGTESNMLVLKGAGNPVEIVYATEGTPFVPSPVGILAKAPHPNAAKLFQSFLFTVELQQLLIDLGERSLHKLANDPPGRRHLDDIRLLVSDPAEIADKAEEIKANYTKYFGV